MKTENRCVTCYESTIDSWKIDVDLYMNGNVVIPDNRTILYVNVYKKIFYMHVNLNIMIMCKYNTILTMRK